MDGHKMNRAPWRSYPPWRPGSGSCRGSAVRGI